jgi:uncharacterized circularly permuted ATP-grasp superfamily protein
MKNYIKSKGFVTLREFEMVNGSTLCSCSSVYPIVSVSPAFDNYLNGELVDTDQYSAWMESSWEEKEIQMRLFMYTTSATQALTLGLGIMVLIVSVFVTFIVNKNAEKWFNYTENVPNTNEIVT